MKKPITHRMGSPSTAAQSCPAGESPVMPILTLTPPSLLTPHT